MNEDSTAIVPVGRINHKQELEYNGLCDVIWSDKKKYRAFLIFSGMFIKFIYIHMCNTYVIRYQQRM